MKYTVATALVLAYAQSVLGLTVNTPTGVVQCQPILLTWSGGAPPYYPSVIPGGQPSGTPLKTFPTTNDGQITWVVDIPADTSITIALKDSTGATAFTDALKIQSGSDSSCLNGSSAANPPPPTTAAGATSPAAAGTTAPGTTSAAPAATSGTIAAGSRAASTSARPTGSQAAASATASSSATRTQFTYGVAGILAADGIALF